MLRLGDKKQKDICRGTMSGRRTRWTAFAARTTSASWRCTG